MKIFPTEYAVATGVTTTPVFTDSAWQSPWTLIPIKANAFDVSINKVFKNELLTGFGFRTERAYDRALAGGTEPNQFWRGLLNHTILSDAVGAAETKEYLEGEHGTQVALEYHHLGPLHLPHAGFEYLANSQGYTAATNRSATQSQAKGFPVYVEAMQVNRKLGALAVAPALDDIPVWAPFPQSLYVPWDNPNKYLDTWTFSESAESSLTFHFAWMSDTPRAGTATAQDWAQNGIPELAVPPDSTADNFWHHGYSFTAAYGTTNAQLEDFIHRSNITVSLSSLNYDEEKNYFQTKYQANVNYIPYLHYFTHAEDAGTIPALESTIELSGEAGQFMPPIYFRERFLTQADRGKAGQLNTQQADSICTLLGLDYFTIGESILDSEEVEIDQICQAYLFWGIPITSETELGARYLFEFFNWLNIGNPRYNSAPYGSGLVWTTATGNERNVIVFSENQTRIRLDYLGTRANVVNGVIGDIGFCDNTELVHTHQYRRYRYVANTQSDSPGWELYTRSVDVPVWRLRKQLTDSRYQEIYVADPKLAHELPGGTTFAGTEMAYIQSNDSLLIPISHTLATEFFQPMHRQQLYAESLHIQVTSYAQEKLSWYETSRFQNLLTAAAIIITIYSLGSTAGFVQGIYASALTTAGGNIVVAIILTGLAVTALQYGLQKVFSLVVKEIGADWGFVSAALATVIATYSLSKGAPNAGEWAMAASGFTDAANAQLAEDLIQFDENLAELQLELDDLTELHDELEAIKDVGKNLMAAIGLASTTNAYESAASYYTRTTSASLGPEISVNSAEIFLNTSLTLPTPETTLGL